MRFEDRRWEKAQTQLAQVMHQHESEVTEALTTYVAEVLSLFVRLPAMSYCEDNKLPVISFHIGYSTKPKPA